MVPCERRTARKDPGHARVTPREMLALAFIAEAQPITTAHYERLLSLHPRIARRSLQKLRDLGMVTSHVSSLNEPNRITLAPGARPVLAQAFGRSPEEYRLLSGIGKVNLPHHDGSVALAVALTVACARSERFQLTRFLFERDIRAQLGARSGSLVPDAAALLRDRAGRERAVAFEVDLATENPSFFARTKGEGYAALQGAGAPLLGCADWVVCLVAPSERRRNRLALSAWEAGVPEGLWYFAVADQVSDRTFLEPVWWTPRLVEGGQGARLVLESPFETRPTGGSNGRTGLGPKKTAFLADFKAGSTGSFSSEEGR